MANVLLGVTGSVAAVRVPALYAGLRERGHRVRVVATGASLYFFDPAALDPPDPLRPERNRDVVFLDEDEWPGRAEGQLYRTGDPVVHIELRRWADLLVIAPLDANTLARLAGGLADSCLTCVWRAWDPGRPVVLAPAMNTLMWEHPFTRRHLRSLAADFSGAHIPGHFDAGQLIAQMNARCRGLRVVPPVAKELACGDVGVGAMAAVDDIVAAVGAMR